MQLKWKFLRRQQYFYFIEKKKEAYLIYFRKLQLEKDRNGRAWHGAKALGQNQTQAVVIKIQPWNSLGICALVVLTIYARVNSEMKIISLLTPRGLSIIHQLNLIIVLSFERLSKTNVSELWRVLAWILFLSIMNCDTTFVVLKREHFNLSWKNLAGVLFLSLS